MEKQLMTAKEAAEVLGIGRSKVYELIASGALTSVRIGTSRRITVGALQSFIDDLATADTDVRATG